MEASIGKHVKQVLSNDRTANILSAAIINSRGNKTVKIYNVLHDGKILVLKRIRPE